ncbi:MAG: alpha-galactosidase [Prevotella sp.]|jgi:alpha-galactosidase|nr:alpha-galactosidase [Prevotella sp.]
MRKLLILVLCLVAFTLNINAQQTIIRISTNETDLILKTAPNGRLYQAYLGERLLYETDIELLPHYISRPASDGISSRGWEVYPSLGSEDYFEPAFSVRHNDGNMTSILYYLSHETKVIGNNVTETIIRMEDKSYPVEVKLHYMSFAKENIIKSWTEIRHNEPKPVRITQYASSMLYFENDSYFLTEYSGDWGREMQMSSQQLQFGKKVIDTKLGSRAAMYAYPFFQLGLGGEVQENQGKVLMGTIGWTGNFMFTFEIDNVNNLRVISGINPYASDYELHPDEVFTTPEFIFTLSDKGVGKAARSFQEWARNNQLKDGKTSRLTLLNNWEATGFNFDEKILKEVISDAKVLGVDMFLLDDGWFGNKYPRVNDQAGLGDWEAMRSKLPNGIPGLVKAAQNAGIKFGIWVEPEMVNPKSELFEKHPDWVILLPNREAHYYRNQLVLDLSNPAVQDYVFGVIDKIMSENPGIAYFKWDCNSPITNVYSPYLKKNQSRLYIDHIRGIYNVFHRINEKYPDLPMMMCSGGGARCDYEALKYFTEFWCSDNTDPVERLYIQWNFLQFFPSKAMAAHVTGWNKSASIKFRVDVAMMCKLGFDINIRELSPLEQSFCRDAVMDYNRLKDVILNGDLFRLVSPYEGNHTALMYISGLKDKAVLYTYDIHPRFSEKLIPVRLQGLDPQKKYRINEINLANQSGNIPKVSTLRENGRVFTGDYLMKIGIDALTATKMHSRIIELTAE